MIYKSSIPERLRWSVQINLNEDLKNIAKSSLIKLGVEPSNDENCVFELFNLEKRLVSRKPRNIRKSKEFVCPSKYEQALLEIENKIKKGNDLKPYMSKNILKSNFNDALLNDWNIHHFHLSKRFNEDGFVKRSDYELFIFFTETTAYLIQIYPHKKQNIYSTQNMIKIIDRNWPQLIEKNRLKGVNSLSSNINDECYANLRKLNVSTFVQTEENKVFWGIGGGYMSNGYSQEALKLSDYCFKIMKLTEQFLKDNIESILKNIKFLNGEVFINLKIHLVDYILRETVILFEESNYIILKFNINENVIDCIKIL